MSKSLKVKALENRDKLINKDRKILAKAIQQEIKIMVANGELTGEVVVSSVCSTLHHIPDDVINSLAFLQQKAKGAQLSVVWTRAFLSYITIKIDL